MNSHSDTPSEGSVVPSAHPIKRPKSYLERALWYSGYHFIATLWFAESLTFGPCIGYAVLTSPLTAAEWLFARLGHEVLGESPLFWSLFFCNDFLYGFSIAYIVHVLVRNRKTGRAGQAVRNASRNTASDF